MSIRLSVVIITLNEEKRIERCLEAARPVADEIVVVDSLSTDGTEEICRRHNVNFIRRPFLGYAEQKNFAVSKAEYPHVLSLDADEVISNELRSSILKVKDNWELDGYTMNRLSNYCGTWIRHAGWYPDRKLRLWDRRKGRWEGSMLHERVVLERGAETGRLEGDLLHYSYDSISSHLERIERYSSIAAEERFARGKRAHPVPAVFRFIFEFKKKYFLKLGILDGHYGFVISALSAYGVLIRDIKLMELRRRAARGEGGPQ